ncbi:MAG: DUF3823 domain-containing protein [Prevotellaceae bacterium]|jgi:hypothetical protein|nr:DUF3823 domain-containing protein [Prevotellaceae bacterium]
MNAKTIKYYLPPILAAALLVHSCRLDNYDAPDASLSGSIIDAETGELLQSDVINGTTIKIIEHGYDPVAPQYLRVKNDGTYANTMLFANVYTVQPDLRNFQEIDKQDIAIGKNTRLDFRVTPYIRVKDVQIVNDGSQIVATFRLQPTTSDVVDKIGLYAHSEPGVGHPIHQVAAEDTLNRQVAEQDTFSLVIDAAKHTALLKAGRAYYFRVGVLSGFPGAKPNYAPAQQISIAP